MSLEKPMNRSKVLKVLNPLMGILFITQIISGLGHHYIPLNVFHFIHDDGGQLLTLLVIAHVVLNLPWIKGTYFKPRKAKPTA